jgi:hypothetical protein
MAIRRLDRLEDKIDKQDERIDKIDISLTEIKQDLKEHMRRTSANEEANVILKEYVDVVKTESDIRLRKLEKIKDNFHFLGWVITGLIGLAKALNSLGFF